MRPPKKCAVPIIFEYKSFFFQKEGEILVPEKVFAVNLFCIKASDSKQNLWDGRYFGVPMTAI